MNEHLLEKFPGEEMVYLSCDIVDKTERNAAIDQSIFSPEFINGLKFSGVLNHMVALKSNRYGGEPACHFLRDNSSLARHHTSQPRRFSSFDVSPRKWGSARISSDIVPFGACVRILMTLLALRIVIAYFDSCTAQDTFCVEEYKVGRGNIVTNSRVTLSWREIVSLTFSKVGVLHVHSTLYFFYFLVVVVSGSKLGEMALESSRAVLDYGLSTPGAALCYQGRRSDHHGDFLFLPDWSGTIGSKTQDIVLEDQRLPLYVTPPMAEGTFIPYNSSTQKAIEKSNAKFDAAREKKDRLNAGKVLAKYAREESFAAPYKRRVLKNQEVVNSGSKGTISITPIHQASPKPVEEGVTFAPKATTRIVVGEAHLVNLERVVIELSENTRPPTPPVISVTHPSSHVQTANSIHSTHQEEGGSSAKHQFVLEWGLRDDMRVSSVRFLGKCVLSQGEQLKKHERLNGEHVALHNQSDVQLEELSHLKNDLQREMQTNNGLNKQLSLLDSAHSSCQDREHELMDQLKEAEKDRDDWRVTASGKWKELKFWNERLSPSLEVVYHKLVRDFIPIVVKKLLASSEYRKNIEIPVVLCYTVGWLGGLSPGKIEDEIAQVLSETRNLDIKGSKTWKDKHHELFTKHYPFIQKIVESYRLHMDTLLQISPDLPSPVEVSTRPSMKVNTKAAVTQAPLLAGDGVACIKRRLRDLSSDGIKNLATTSGRGRLKEDLESYTWRRCQDYKATPSHKYMESLELGKNGSTFIKGEVSAKMEDPGLFTLPCRSGDSKTFDTLADLGSCVNIIPLYLFKKINKGILEETGHIFGLANGTKSYLVGIVKDVEVHVGKLKLLNNFYVIDMKKDPETPLLVGRGFLAIANAVIDCRKAKIAVGERITRSVFGVKGVDLGEEEEPYWTTLGKKGIIQSTP
nr:hypothetical protein [Tanacetum cinerariifolium]